MNSLNDILSQWLGQILATVKTKQANKQRHKKIVKIGGKNEKFRKITDITSTGNQQRYPNTNIESVVTSIIGENGNDASRYCISNSVRRDLMMQKRIDHLFEEPKKGDELLYEEMIAAFKNSITSQANCKDFANKAANEWKQFQKIYNKDTAATEADIFDFARKVYIPQYLYSFINTSNSDVWRTIEKVQDADLYKQLLTQTDQTPAAEQAIRQFLSNRLATNTVDLAVDLQVELQNLFPDVQLDTISNSDKCALSLFYNIKRALGQIQSAPSSQPQDTKKIKLLKGIDRTPAALAKNPVYSALVRTERAKVAASHAVRMYTAGLALIQKGNYASRGHNLIYNYADGAFRNTSAASAVLLMYIELMDYFINPSPPLINRTKMKNGLCLRNFDDLKTRTISEVWPSWSEEQKRAYRAQHDEYLREFMNVGFSIEGQHEVTELPTLNIDDWGQGEEVPNPFRVREDTFLFKYFGALRLKPNRLGIGKEARDIWRKHTVKRNYDKDYEAEFDKYLIDQKIDSTPYSEYLKRPIYDINFCGEGEGQGLREEVCIEYKNGPIDSTKRRKRMDDVNKKYHKVSPCKFEYSTKRNVLFSRMASAALDIHRHLYKLTTTLPIDKNDNIDFPGDLLSDYGPNGKVTQEDRGPTVIVDLIHFYSKNIRNGNYDNANKDPPSVSDGQWDLRVSLSALLDQKDKIPSNKKGTLVPPTQLSLDVTDKCISEKKSTEKAKKKLEKKAKDSESQEEETRKFEKQEKKKNVNLLISNLKETLTAALKQQKLEISDLEYKEKKEENKEFKRNLRAVYQHEIDHEAIKENSPFSYILTRENKIVGFLAAGLEENKLIIRYAGAHGSNKMESPCDRLCLLTTKALVEAYESGNLNVLYVPPLKTIETTTLSLDNKQQTIETPSFSIGCSVLSCWVRNGFGLKINKTVKKVIVTHKTDNLRMIQPKDTKLDFNCINREQQSIQIKWAPTTYMDKSVLFDTTFATIVPVLLENLNKI